MRSGWLDQARAVGAAFLAVLRAELEALAEELRLARRRLTSAVVFFLVALFILFWALGALAYAGVELLVLWGLPRWGGALVLVGALLAAAGLSALLGWLKLRRLESPTATALRRWEEHRRWWEERALPGGRDDGGPGAEADGADAAP